MVVADNYLLPTLSFQARLALSLTIDMVVWLPTGSDGVEGRQQQPEASTSTSTSSTGNDRDAFRDAVSIQRCIEALHSSCLLPFLDTQLGSASFNDMASRQVCPKGPLSHLPYASSNCILRTWVPSSMKSQRLRNRLAWMATHCGCAQLKKDLVMISHGRNGHAVTDH